jgi:integrase
MWYALPWKGRAMVKQGKHPEKALTAVAVRQKSQPGRYADGNGLYLVVDPSLAKRWVLRTVVNGLRRDIGLGGLSLVSLAEAREQALQLRKLARSGGDPLAERRKAKVVVPTFAEAAELVYAEHKPGWKNQKHAAQWINTLRTYVFPTLGERPVNQIHTPDILKVLGPIWLTKPETATRVKQRINTVLDWAKAAGHRSGDNPVDGVEKGLPRQANTDDHHAALPFKEVPAFVQRLRSAKRIGEGTRLAFEFLILTAARTGEVLGARWEEINENRAEWVIPGTRMKAGREHRVPLSPRCLEILKRARELACGSDYLFPGMSPGKPLSNMAFTMILRGMEIEATTHGFRSCFSDWAAETTNFPREVCEMALAHTIKNKAEAAYRRGDLLVKRRELMDAWAGFVGKLAQAE